MVDHKQGDTQRKDVELSSGADASEGENMRQSLLATLIELDFAYERERTMVDQSSSGAGSKARTLRRLQEQHRQRRQPYLRKLALLQERAGSETDVQSGAARIGTLSSQEAEILCSVMQGSRNDVIAVERGISEAAVREHIKSILRKVHPERSRPGFIGKPKTGE